MYKILEGDLNTKLDFMEGKKDGVITTYIAAEGIEDMYAHFRLHQWCQNGRIWGILHQLQEVNSEVEYVLGTNQ